MATFDNDLINLGAGDDIFDIAGAVTSDTVYGGAGADKFIAAGTLSQVPDPRH